MWEFDLSAQICNPPKPAISGKEKSTSQSPGWHMYKIPFPFTFPLRTSSCTKDFLRLETNYVLKLTISNSFPEYVAKIFPTLLNNQGTVLERSTYAILFSRLHVKINIASRVSSHSCFTASCNPLATCPTNRYIILERESAKKRDQPIDASKVRVFCVYSGSPRTSSF